jgi:CubicO group peptidase (beta-lactamase class C family)
MQNLRTFRAHSTFWLIIMAFSLTSRLVISDPVPSLGSVLEPIRVKYKLPALAGAIFTTDGVVEMAAVGVRKAGTTVAVTTNDLWHLGSDTKMMTAALAGTFVVEKKLSWDDKVISFFPELTDKIAPAIKNITVAQVLCHEAGLSENLSLWSRAFLSGSPSQQRQQAIATILEYPAYPPGTFHYANNDYILIGAILEKIDGKPWEDLIRERIFNPLHMDSAGFRGTGTISQIDQPWPHFANGWPAPSNGPDADNPAYIGPAGNVHCSMADWAKFLIDQLRGGSGMKALLPNDIYLTMQTNFDGSNEYGYGWCVTSRSWAGGKALTHTGSNTMNFCNCWLAPAKKFGVLVCTNQGGAPVFNATDAAASAMIERYLASLKAQLKP